MAQSKIVFLDVDGTITDYENNVPQSSKDAIKAVSYTHLVCKTVKSNAILIAKDEMGIGMGPGQPNRVDSALLACQRADEVCERLGLSLIHI